MTIIPKLSSNGILLGLSSEDLQKFARQEGEKAFRGRQIHEWIYQRGAKSLDSITVLPKKWRDSLENKGINIGRLDEINNHTLQYLLIAFLDIIILYIFWGAAQLFRAMAPRRLRGAPVRFPVESFASSEMTRFGCV